MRTGTIFIILLLFLVGIVAADENITSCRYLEQGDIAYWAECVDLTGVAGWDMKIAHWNKSYVMQIGYPDDYPDIIYDVSSFPERIYIDPYLYPTGPWYKWSGKDESGGSNLAFFVAKGRESTNKTINITPTMTLYEPQPVFTPTPTPLIIYQEVKVIETVEVPILVNNTIVVEVTPKIPKNNRNWAYQMLTVLVVMAVAFAAYKTLKK